MKVRFLGTAAAEGFPALFCECRFCREARERGGRNLRGRSSLLVNEDFLVDLGQETYARTLYQGLDLVNVEWILQTHAHEDHLALTQIVNIFEPKALERQTHTLHLAGDPTVIDLVREKMAQTSRVNPLELTTLVPGQWFELGDYRVYPIQANHDPHEICLLPILQNHGRTLWVCHDTGVLHDDAWAQLAASGVHLDLVIMDCTTVDWDRATAVGPYLSIAPFASHMGLTENLELRDRLLELGIASADTQFISTHFAHMFAPLQERLDEVFAGTGITPAYDGLEITL